MNNGSHNAKYVTLYSSKAHVFQINPETKTSWLAKCERAIPISFVTSILSENSSTNESSKRELKIIGTSDNGDTVLDATILPVTTFTKRSPKFGQWVDHTGTVHGLGFNSQPELDEFIETFQQLQRDVLPAAVSHRPRQQQQQQLQSQSSDNLQSQMAPQGDRLAWNQKQQQHQQNYSNSISETNGRYQVSKGGTASMQQQYTNTQAHPGHMQMKLQHQQPSNNGDTSLNNGNDNNDIIIGSNNVSRSQSMFGLQSKTNNNSSTISRATPEHESSPTSPAEWQIREQLKYENERLKQALEESSKNSVVWHNELLNLRTNNVKLTQALQDSKAHVEEWERELLSLRDENKELKLRVQALESGNDPEKGNEYKKDLQKYKNYVDEIQSELKRKENEIDELQRSMEEMELKNRSSSHDADSTQLAAISSHQKQKFDIISAKLEAKISELASVQKEFSQLVDKLYH